jgi:hypothetical protein
MRVSSADCFASRWSVADVTPIRAILRNPFQSAYRGFMRSIVDIAGRWPKIINNKT